jgi:SAM-dependent methyltransferase
VLFGRADRATIRGDHVRVQYRDPRSATEYAETYEDGPSERYFTSRLHAVAEELKTFPSGDLLDVGCGPGMMVRHLLDTRPRDFRITACDQSAAMVDAVAARLKPNESVRLQVADIDNLPFPWHSFDIVLAMGVLEYVEVRSALREIARVTRPGGHVIVTMLNPLSPYRLFEWGVLWPARRLLGQIEHLLGVPAQRRHRARRSGIRALPAGQLGSRLREAGLRVRDVVYFDITTLVPPVDRLTRLTTQPWRYAPERTMSRRSRRWLGTGYLILAQAPAGTPTARPTPGPAPGD